MKFNQKLTTEDGTEVLLYPMEYGHISQGMHSADGVYYNAYDLGGKYFSKYFPEGSNDPEKEKYYEPVYAPCSMTIVYAQEKSDTNTIIFLSDEPVLLADGTVSRVAILMAHCDDNSEFIKKNHFNQGEICYREGTYGNGKVNTFNIHLHIEVVKTDINGSYNTIYYPFSLEGSIPLEQAFYKNGTDESPVDGNNRSNLNDYGFKEYFSHPFDPTNKSDGWHQYNGFYYYVENHTCVTGWKKLDGCWFYFNKDGIMHTGWLADGKEANGDVIWYYMGDSSGVMQVNSWVDNQNYYVGSDGKMLRSGWTLIDGSYYYLKSAQRDVSDRFANFKDGQKVTNTWIPGSAWYYVKSDGKMAVNETININGKNYQFDQSGACLNP